MPTQRIADKKIFINYMAGNFVRKLTAVFFSGIYSTFIK